MPTKKKDQNYSHEWIYELENPYHWNLYWHQLDLVLNRSSIRKEGKIVEVGIGTGLTSSSLRRKGFDVTTVDIDPNKAPDIVADITKNELPKADLYMAFEIFEHIPLESAKDVWKRLADNMVYELVFSIPYAYRTYLWLDIWSPFFAKKGINLGRRRNHINTKHHHWELGINKISAIDVKSWLSEINYEVSEDYRYRNHHFFLCKLNH